jgi:adenylate kinase family enzyme
MSTVLALSGKIASGKSTLANEFAKEVGWPCVSFGDYVRSVARDRGLVESREILQEVGDKLIRTNLEGFCQSVLAQADWKPGQALVIEGVRHAEVNTVLRSLVAPSKYVLAYLKVDDQIRKDRLRDEGIGDKELIHVETHPTEEQVTRVLPYIADYVFEGSSPIPLILDWLRSISADVPPETELPIPNVRVTEIIDSAYHLSRSERREVIARIWPDKARSGREIWRGIRFSDRMRVVAYAPEQEPYLHGLRELLLNGALARVENEREGNYEIYGPDRTYFVTMTPDREFAALLSSWSPDRAPREVVLQGT